MRKRVSGDISPDLLEDLHNEQVRLSAIRRRPVSMRELLTDVILTYFRHRDDGPPENTAREAITATRKDGLRERKVRPQKRTTQKSAAA